MNVKQNSNKSALIKIFGIAGFVLILDQITKIMVKSYMNLRESIPIIGNALRLTYIENDGMAFGIAINNKFLFNSFSILAAFMILYYLIRLRHNHFMPKFALAAIFGGAIGNLIDRLIYGRVVDFLDANIPDIPSFNLYFFTTPAFNRWPIFNVADIAVSVGMFLLIFTVIFSESPWYLPKPAENTEGEPAAEENKEQASDRVTY